MTVTTARQRRALERRRTPDAALIAVLHSNWRLIDWLLRAPAVERVENWRRIALIAGKCIGQEVPDAELRAAVEWIRNEHARMALQGANT